METSRTFPKSGSVEHSTGGPISRSPYLIYAIARQIDAESVIYDFSVPDEGTMWLCAVVCAGLVLAHAVVRNVETEWMVAWSRDIYFNKRMGEPS